MKVVNKFYRIEKRQVTAGYENWEPVKVFNDLKTAQLEFVSMPEEVTFYYRLVIVEVRETVEIVRMDTTEYCNLGETV